MPSRHPVRASSMTVCKGSLLIASKPTQERAIFPDFLPNQIHNLLYYKKLLDNLIFRFKSKGNYTNLVCNKSKDKDFEKISICHNSKGKDCKPPQYATKAMTKIESQLLHKTKIVYHFSMPQKQKQRLCKCTISVLSKTNEKIVYMYHPSTPQNKNEDCVPSSNDTEYLRMSQK